MANQGPTVYFFCIVFSVVVLGVPWMYSCLAAYCICEASSLIHHGISRNQFSVVIYRQINHEIFMQETEHCEPLLGLMVIFQGGASAVGLFLSYVLSILCCLNMFCLTFRMS